MASEADQGERTEDATQQRREDFRKRGQVAQTRELSSVLLLFSCVILIWVSSHFIFRQIYELFNETLGASLVDAIRSGETTKFVSMATAKVGLLILPMFSVFWLIGFASSLVQVGFLYNEEALEIRWERM